MDGELFPRERTLIAPGAVHVPDWLGPLRQRELLAACREWARPPAGLRTVSTPGGGTMTARQVCLGLHWYPYAYARTAVDGDGAPVKPMPGWLAELGRDAVAAAYAGTGDAGKGDAGVPAGPSEAYDIALINFYDGDARMGMHRDAEERSAAPVVSSASATPASSGSATPPRAAARTGTSSCAAGTCSSSAARAGGPITGCRGCCPAPHRRRWASPAG